MLDTCPGYHLGKAYKKVTRVFEEEFRSCDLSLPQFAVLVNTGVAEASTGTEIAERLGSDLSTISRTMELVMKRGLVEQRRAEDRRVRLYSLSSAGREKLAEALPKWKRAKRRILSSVDGEKWNITLGALAELGETVD